LATPLSAPQTPGLEPQLGETTDFETMHSSCQANNASIWRFENFTSYFATTCSFPKLQNVDY